MFFTALTFGAGIFLYYFPEDCAKLLIPYLDTLNELGVEANMINKRNKGDSAITDESQQISLAREYIRKGKRLFVMLVILSFASSIVSGAISFIFGSSRSSSSRTVPNVYGYVIDTHSVVVVDGLNEDLAIQISTARTFSDAGRVYFVPEESTSPNQIARVVDGNIDVVDDVPGIRAGINVVLSVVLPRPPCDGHGHDDAEIYALQFEHIRKQVLRLYKSLIEYGMNEGKIVFAAVAGDDEAAILTRAAISAAVGKISSKRSSRLEAYAAYGSNMEGAVAGALLCFENPSKCNTVNLLESSARVMSFLASELMFAPKLSTGMSAAFADKPEARKRFEQSSRYGDNPGRRYEEGRKLPFFSGLTVLVTRILTFLYPVLETIKVVANDDDNDERLVRRRQLWRKYWILFAFASVVEETILKQLWFILFLPAECLKLILLSKCILPGPEVAGKAYDNIAGRIEAFVNEVSGELRKQRRLKFSKIQQKKRLGGGRG
mmetsp:Transcript_1480/g.2156  ORF Transcript_1480/g.2156 Transcript_1480/m.2156 type:complete len:492 (-) Transcript_1480:2497-3972(-)